ncbi:hypothetical protein PG984_002773 [Apiospora sp. TS-2023a]
MSARSYNRAFTQPGFQLGQGSPLGDAATTARICIAIVGPANINAKDMQEAVAKAIESLFDNLNEKTKLFRALRDTEIFWGTIAADWDGPIHAELSGSDIELVARIYIKGRRAVMNSIKNTDSARNQEATHLMDAVDAWTEVADKVADEHRSFQPPFDVTIRQHPVTVAAQMINELDLSAVGRVWPPKWFNAQERAWASDSHVEWQMRKNIELFPFDAGRIHEKDIPKIPNGLTHPQDVKLFLCWAAMARYDPAESKFAVFMAPIAFMDSDDRKNNYLATGSLSKGMATIAEFFDYALHMINSQGREMVIGMMTYWIDPPNDRCVRHGLGLALRRTPKRDTRVQGYQVILYDPEHAKLMRQPREPHTQYHDHNQLILSLHEWREEVELVADEKLKGKGKKSQFAEFWSGGKKPVILQKEYGVPLGDSVSHVAAWVFDAVVGGKFPAPKASIVELEDQWKYEDINTLPAPGPVQKKAFRGPVQKAFQDESELDNVGEEIEGGNMRVRRWISSRSRSTTRPSTATIKFPLRHRKTSPYPFFLKNDENVA